MVLLSSRITSALVVLTPGEVAGLTVMIVTTSVFSQVTVLCCRMLWASERHRFFGNPTTSLIHANEADQPVPRPHIWQRGDPLVVIRYQYI